MARRPTPFRAGLLLSAFCHPDLAFATCHFESERLSPCHFERAKRVEKSIPYVLRLQSPVQNSPLKIIAFAFALASEIERNLISQRTKEALAVKKVSGVKLGRPSRMTPKVRKLCDELNNVRNRLASGESKASLAREYGVHRNTLDKCLRVQEEKTP